MSEYTYPPVPGIDDSLFVLSDEGRSEEDRHKALQQLEEHVAEIKRDFLGYQANQKLDYQAELGQYLDVQLNNIGDPFQEGNFRLNTKWIERHVLDYFAKLWNVPYPHLADRQQYSEEQIGESYWGYVVSMGSTEGNLYGLRNARDYLAGKVLAADRHAPQCNTTGKKHSRVRKGRFLHADTASVVDNENAYLPVLFYSNDTHYSIDKVKDILALPAFSELGQSLYPTENPLAPGSAWPAKVPSNADGAIDIPALATLVDFFAAKGHPIVVNFNYGTTFKGAYDDVGEAAKTLLPILEAHGLKERVLQVDIDGSIVQSPRTGYWFHVDGALGAAYGPFLEKASASHPELGALPSFDFRNPIHSIAVSGHKELGAPWPSGIFITRTKYLLNFVDIGYIGAQDSTLSGSRNGFSALILWHYLARHSYQAQVDKILGLLQLSASAYEKLQGLQTRLGRELYLHRSPFSLSVLFLRPNDAIVQQFSLSTEQEDGIDYAHLFAMEHVTEALLDRLIEALGQPGAFPDTGQPRLLNAGSGFR